MTFVLRHRIVLLGWSGSEMPAMIVSIKSVEGSAVMFATIARNARWTTRVRVVRWGCFCSNSVVVNVWSSVLAVVSEFNVRNGFVLLLTSSGC
jgi:hypothetical protein